MKMSEITYLDILSKGKENVEDIVFINEEETKENLDVGILFGGVSMIPYRANKAVNLYKEGQIKKIVATGGIGYTNKDRHISEASKMQRFLVENGIPSSDILLEEKSRSSYENIKYTLELLREKYVLSNLKLGLITSDFHVKRCMKMMEMALETDKGFYGLKAKDGKFDIENWHTTFSGQKRIYFEALSLCYYVKKGTINDFEVETLTRK